MDIKQFLMEFKLSKRVLYWIIGLLAAAVVLSYKFGGEEAHYILDFKELKESSKENKELLMQTNSRIDSLQSIVNRRFDQSNEKQIEIITNLQDNINDQFQFIIDHREQDKKLLKDALMMSQKNLNENIIRNIEKNIDDVQSDKDKQLDQDKSKIVVIKKDDYVKVTGISEKELNDLKSKYEILKSEKIGDKYDVIYLKK